MDVSVCCILVSVDVYCDELQSDALDERSNFRISRSCNDSSVSNAAAAAEVLLLVLPSLLSAVEVEVERELRKAAYLVATFDNEPRAAIVPPPPVTMRSRSVSFNREGGAGIELVAALLLLFVMVNERYLLG